MLVANLATVAKALLRRLHPLLGVATMKGRMEVPAATMTRVLLEVPAATTTRVLLAQVGPVAPVRGLPSLVIMVQVVATPRPPLPQAMPLLPRRVPKLDRGRSGSNQSLK